MPRKIVPLLVFVTVLALGAVWFAVNLSETSPSPGDTPAAEAEVQPAETAEAEAASPAPEAAEPEPANLALAGTVLGLDEQPAAGIEVWAYSVALPRDFGTAVSGPDGTFRIEGLRHAAYDLVAAADAGTALARAAGVDAEQVLRLMPRAALAVRALDAAGNPVVDAATTLARPEENNNDGLADEVAARLNLPPVAGGPGEFTYAIGAPGTYQVHATSASDGTGSSGLLLFTESTVRMTVDIKVLAGQPVSGRVTDKLGRAVARATVTLAPAAETPGEMPQLLMTGEDGTFTFPEVHAGTYSLRVEAAGFAPWTQAELVVLASSPKSGLQVILTAGGAITGTCTRDGAPVADANISIHGPGGPRTVQTDAEGRYALADLGAGAYLVELISTLGEGGSPLGLRTRARAAVVNDGQSTEVNFEETDGQTVSGKVTGAGSGQVMLVRLRIPDGGLLPVLLEGAEYSPEVLASVVARGYAQPDGSFTLEGVPEGDYVAEVFAIDLAAARAEGVVPGVGLDTPDASVPVQVGAQPVTVEVALP